MRTANVSLSPHRPPATYQLLFPADLPPAVADQHFGSGFSHSPFVWVFTRKGTSLYNILAINQPN